MSVKTRHLRALSHLQAKELGRYAINGVLMSPDELVATDGRTLGVIRQTKDAELEGLKPCIMETSMILRALPKNKDADLVRVDVDATNANGHVALQARTLGSLVANKIEAGFPDYKACIARTPEAKLEVMLGFDVLESVVKAAKEFAPKATKNGPDAIGIKFSIADAESAIRFSVQYDGEELFGLLMPITL